MFNIHREEIEWGGRKLVLETGRIARQADGAVLATYGETVVLATAVGETQPKPGIDFFPLTVNYQEKFYASGKIPGGYFKREGRPTERETLISRLIDRPIRPLFPDGFLNEVQVVVHVLSVNPEIDPDIPAMIGASAALSVSGIPFKGPIGAARVAYVDGQYVINPTATELKSSKLDLVVAGTERAVLMVESEADQLPEDVMLGAVVHGHEQMQAVIDAITTANLRGRGGAGFPTGRKASLLAKDTGKPVYLVVNADESEPGAFKDRDVMRFTPHRLIEGCLITAHGIESQSVFIYIRGEYPEATARLEAAIAAATRRGFLGAGILGSGFACDLEVRRGGGAYPCREACAKAGARLRAEARRHRAGRGEAAHRAQINPVPL